ncbi:hypothetical protein F442_04779, partial [Phytophthora nicotianae P10297]
GPLLVGIKPVFSHRTFHFDEGSVLTSPSTNMAPLCLKGCILERSHHRHHKIRVIQSRILDAFSKGVLEFAGANDLIMYPSHAACQKNEKPSSETRVNSSLGLDDPLIVVVQSKIFDAPVPGLNIQEMTFDHAELQLDCT